MIKQNKLLPPSIFHNEIVENLQKTGIYCIYFKHKPDKFYIGSSFIKGNEIISSKGIWQRWKHHLCLLAKNKHHSIHLQRTFNKHGRNNIQFKIIEYVEDKSKLIEKEQYWMDFYDSYKKGYNCCKYASSSNKEMGKTNQTEI